MTTQNISKWAHYCWDPEFQDSRSLALLAQASLRAEPSLLSLPGAATSLSSRLRDHISGSPWDEQGAFPARRKTYFLNRKAWETSLGWVFQALWRLVQKTWWAQYHLSYDHIPCHSVATQTWDTDLCLMLWEWMWVWGLLFSVNSSMKLNKLFHKHVHHNACNARFGLLVLRFSGRPLSGYSTQHSQLLLVVPTPGNSGVIVESGHAQGPARPRYI